MTTEKLLAQKMPRKIPATSPHAVTVPGAIEAWEAILKAHGRFGLDRALQPAIGHAEDGFVIAPRVGYDWAEQVAKLTPHAGSAKYYLPNGGAPEVGSTVRLPALAATLKAIAAGGAKAFYEGAIAADIAATVQAAGGLLAEEDLARHRGDVVTPISDELSRTRRRRTAAERAGADRAGAAQHPGAVRFRASSIRHGPERLHLTLEAARLAFGVRDAHIADPATCASRWRACSTRASRRSSPR